MPVAAAQPNTKIGTCPHGMPAGACPICNGMAGGNSTTKRNIPRNKGEMTYNQCLAVWNMMKAQKAAKREAQQAHQKHLNALADFKKLLNNAQNKILNITVSVAKNTPAILAKPLNFILSNLIAKPLKFAARIAGIYENVIQKLSDVAAKLTAVLGEFKVAIQKNISEKFSNFKKKIKSLFSIFSVFDTDDDEKKVEEAKKAFNLKTFIHRLISNKKENKNDKRNTV